MFGEVADSQQVWMDFRKLWDDTRAAFTNEDYGKVLVLMDKGDRIIDERMVYFETHKEIRADLAEQRKDSQAIANIEYKGENAVTASELMNFVSALLNFVSAHVSNPKERQAILTDVQTLITVDTNDTERINRLTDG